MNKSNKHHLRGFEKSSRNHLKTEKKIQHLYESQRKNPHQYRIYINQSLTPSVGDTLFELIMHNVFQ